MWCSRRRGFYEKDFKKKTRIAAPAIPFSSGTLLPLSEFDPDDLQSDHALLGDGEVPEGIVGEVVRSHVLADDPPITSTNKLACC